MTSDIAVGSVGGMNRAALEAQSSYSLTLESRVENVGKVQRLPWAAPMETLQLLAYIA